MTAHVRDHLADTTRNAPVVPQKPSKGRMVHVQVRDAINGQHEMAAIISQVWSDEMVNVTVFPGSGQPFTLGSIFLRDGAQYGEQLDAMMLNVSEDTQKRLDAGTPLINSWFWPARV
jgi:hypothetical protein